MMTPVSFLYCFLAVYFTLGGKPVNSVCVSFEITSKSVSDNGEKRTVHLTFAVNNTCTGENTSVRRVTLLEQTSRQYEPPICHIKFKHGVCTFSPVCSCNQHSNTFSVTKRLESTDNARWLLDGQLENDVTFNKTVDIQPIVTTPKRALQQTSLGISSEITGTTTTAVSKVTPAKTTIVAVTTTVKVTSTTEASTLSFHAGLYIMGGCIGFVLLVVTALAIFVGRLYMKKGRLRRLPPPPAPHNVRRAVGNAVMFHAGQDDCDSFVSMQGHEYAEIPDSSDLSTSHNTSTSSDTYPVSDSSMSDDCLHYIACPSSDSSLPEDYLHPVASASGDAAPDTPREAPSSRKTGKDSTKARACETSWTPEAALVSVELHYQNDQNAQ
ncbi:hypothetical protein V1264_017459 [Littorina saxatilis]|uniref:Uncharacterized protein n=1 Tax=Littorina saxatilis TaxID=31220 RepID=A0AAN9GF77_9CAEN